jgi:hypothetical protein
MQVSVPVDADEENEYNDSHSLYLTHTLDVARDALSLLLLALYALQCITFPFFSFPYSNLASLSPTLTLTLTLTLTSPLNCTALSVMIMSAWTWSQKA